MKPTLLQLEQRLSEIVAVLGALTGFPPSRFTGRMAGKARDYWNSKFASDGIKA